MSFDDLVAKFGEPQLIPHDDLYNWLVEHREDLINEQKLGLERIPESGLGREVIRRCKTDLFWLARYFTWCSNPEGDAGHRSISDNLILGEAYKQLCSLFVQKDDSKPLTEQSDFKTRILLWPRNGLKTTIDHCDTVQLILNWPNIRILYLTAEVSLAKGFVGEIKGHFAWREEEPTWMNLFFPRFCLLEKDMGAATSFTCPLFAAKKTKRKEPTVEASSVSKHKAGRHYEVIKADDAVSDKNSESSEQCEIISGKLFLAEKLLNLGGHYVDYIGTRYADEDHYGVVLEKNLVGDVTITDEGKGWTLYENRTTATKILIGRAITIKPEIVQKLESENRPVTYQEAGEDGCVLLLPHIMPFKWLMNDFAKNEKSFEGQRNQNPRPTSELEFTRALLLQNTVPHTEMPLMGAVTQVWDFAFSKKKGRDFSVGCSIIWTERDETRKELDPATREYVSVKTGNKVIVGYIQEIVRDRFNHLTLARAVVDLAEKYRPFIVGIENAAGSSLLTEQIKSEAFRRKNQQLLQVCGNIDWFSPDNQKDAKKVRMRSTYPWFVEGRLKFFNACFKNKDGQVDLEPMYTEFEKCLTSHHHDDIPDVVAMQLRYAPKANLAIIENNENAMVRNDPFYNMVFENGDQFGRPGYGMPEPINFDPELYDDYLQAEAPNGLRSILGAGLFG